MSLFWLARLLPLSALIVHGNGDFAVWMVMTVLDVVEFLEGE